MGVSKIRRAAAMVVLVVGAVASLATSDEEPGEGSQASVAGTPIRLDAGTPVVTGTLTITVGALEQPDVDSLAVEAAPTSGDAPVLVSLRPLDAGRVDLDALTSRAGGPVTAAVAGWAADCPAGCERHVAYRFELVDPASGPVEIAWTAVAGVEDTIRHEIALTATEPAPERAPAIDRTVLLDHVTLDGANAVAARVIRLHVSAESVPVVEARLLATTAPGEDQPLLISLLAPDEVALDSPWPADLQDVLMLDLAARCPAAAPCDLVLWLVVASPVTPPVAVDLVLDMRQPGVEVVGVDSTVETVEPVRIEADLATPFPQGRVLLEPGASIPPDSTVLGWTTAWSEQPVDADGRIVVSVAGGVATFQPRISNRPAGAETGVALVTACRPGPPCRVVPDVLGAVRADGPLHVLVELFPFPGAVEIPPPPMQATGLGG